MTFYDMNTLQQDIDDLDRMVDCGAPKDAVRSQIRLIAREVAALQAEFTRLAEAHEKLQTTQSQPHATVVPHTMRDRRHQSGIL